MLTRRFPFLHGLISALCRTILRLTPSLVIRKFVSGQYHDNLNKDERHPGWLPWHVTRFFVRTALWGGDFVSHEELNSNPLAETFLRAYHSAGGRHPLPKYRLTVQTNEDPEGLLPEDFFTEEGARTRLHELYRHHTVECNPAGIRKAHFLQNSASVEYRNGRWYFWNIEPEEECQPGPDRKTMIIDPDSDGPVTEEQKRSLLDKLERIYNEIAEEAGMNVSYCESMNGSIFPHVVLLSLDDEEADLGSVDFLAQNGFLFPKELQGRTRDEFKKYLDAHEREILSELESVAQSDYKDRCSEL